MGDDWAWTTTPPTSACFPTAAWCAASSIPSSPSPAARLDLSILEPLPAAFLADAGFRRRGDVVWRAGVAGDPSLAALVLFEFQSRPDARMVQRMEVYKALCLDAATRHPWGKDVGRLRLVPVVVYNGARKWTAPLDAPPVWDRRGAGRAEAQLPNG